jgi:hypothetical protein
MDQFIPELPQIEASNRGPWLWQVRRFQDDAVVILREIRGQRLQSGRYPTRQEHLCSSTCDAGILVEIIENWDCGWQVPYVVLRIAARGLYFHPDVRDLAVQGVRVANYVDEVLEFVIRRGYALGLLEAEMCGRYEAPWEGDEPHPLIALHEMTEGSRQHGKGRVDGGAGRALGRDGSPPPSPIAPLMNAFENFVVRDLSW